MQVFLLCFSVLKLQDTMQEATIGFCAAARCKLYMSKGPFCLLMAGYGQGKKKYQCLFKKKNEK